MSLKFAVVALDWTLPLTLLYRLDSLSRVALLDLETVTRA